MGVRARLLPASFRGVAFSVLRTGARGLARRAQVHEYPNRETPYVEDTGKQAAAFDVEGFVSWDGDAREKLIAACAVRGAGTLVHPLFGVRQVVCLGCDTDDGADTAGVTRVRLSFQEAGDNAFPGERTSSGDRVGTSVQTLREKLQAKFAAAFRGAVPQWVTDKSLGYVKDAAAFINEAATLVPGAQDLASFNVLTFAIASGTPAMFSDPNALGVSISSAIHQLTSLASNPLAVFRVLEQFATFGSGFDSSDESTPARVAQVRQRNAVVHLVRGSAAAEAGEVAAAIPLDSYDAAVALRERVVALLDPEVEFAGDSDEEGADDTYSALRSVLVEVVRDLRERGGQLARVRRVTLASTTPAVVLAYRLYGDPDRDEEIVARNGLRHPLFVPGAVPLEVLSS